MSRFIGWGGHLKRLAVALVLLASVGASQAQAAKLRPELSGIAFLVGDWSTGRGVVAETGGTSTGSSRIAVAANGAVLLRQDTTNLFDKGGKPSGSFGQVMMIYSEDGGLRADYSDGSHVIHYTRADVAPGKSVTFSSAEQPGAPVFRLTYTLAAPETLAVSFGMSPPGSPTFSPIAAGTLHKGR
jgi:hypothetical protein